MEPVYCLCRSADVKTFMICCDRCEEWFHGTCINITESESRYIRCYYCDSCCEQRSDLRVVFKSKSLLKGRVSRRLLERFDVKDKQYWIQKLEEIKNSKDHTNEVTTNYVEDDRKNVFSKTETTNYDEEDRKKNIYKTELVTDDINNSELITSRKHQSLNSSDNDVWEPPSVEYKRRKHNRHRRRRPLSKSCRKRSSLAFQDGYKSCKENTDSADETPLDRVGGSARQCYGLNCDNEARHSSKYCSDQCGINLAAMRIYLTVPQRCLEWKASECEANKISQKALEHVIEQQTTVKKRLQQLMVDFNDLERLIELGKQCSVINNAEPEVASETVEDAVTIACVTCGVEVNSKSAVRHMERCYNKIESQTSFASRFKTQIEDKRMFCDAYNPKEETYCKRLKVLCPEHAPGGGADSVKMENTVCGYPLQEGGIFGRFGGSFCRLSKKKCSVHYNWEKLRRAELDMERVAEWLKVDDLIEQERVIRNAMTNRAGLLGLMLHSTVKHDDINCAFVSSLKHK